MWPVILGGVLAICGGIIGHLITHKLTKSREKDTLFRQRIENLVRSLFEHSRWIKNEAETIALDTVTPYKPSSLDEARMLQQLYFPELSGEIIDIMKADLKLTTYINEQRLERIKDVNSWMDSFSPESYSDLYRIYSNAISTAVIKCHKMIKSKSKVINN